MNSNEKRIRDLLQKYYQGETTIDEEDLLTQLFATASIPSDLLADRELFAPQLGMSPNLQFEMEQEVLHTLDEQKSKRKYKSAKVLRLVITWAAAASVVIVLGVTGLLTSNSNEDLFVDTYDDPYLALQETQRVLALVGSKINMVQSEMQSLEKLQLPTQMLEPMSEFSKNLQHLNKIKTIEKPKEIPFIKHIFELDYNDKSVND